MDQHRMERLQSQREKLEAAAAGLPAGDPQAEDLKKLIKDIDRLLPRTAPREKPPRRKVTEPESSVLIATVPKSERTQIRIHLKVWEGRQIIDLRLYARGKGSGDHKPTGKGVSFEPVDLAAVLSGLTLAQQYAPVKG
ncbi:PC4/YdbC family ssDNA-binding protein [Hydrogenophaga sp. BPS33]|uniref:PC4/YdbC family ssDNA-binding protein n=1 Tax=Hydrogenophaga sp. BPS33 TaxID=2651974 RepID=UPI00132001BE|nr:PC4/YdbC family ssDNA-binding protein [Hydrogenophaga sp. BPS33]QHE86307.1 hypothetical protein F9K07_16050 [Hydrogenophaga sp. BPS33]